jgi:hypothetical protein
VQLDPTHIKLFWPGISWSTIFWGLVDCRCRLYMLAHTGCRFSGVQSGLSGLLQLDGFSAFTADEGELGRESGGRVNCAAVRTFGGRNV